MARRIPSPSSSSSSSSSSSRGRRNKRQQRHEKVKSDKGQREKARREEAAKSRERRRDRSASAARDSKPQRKPKQESGRSERRAPREEPAAGKRQAREAKEGSRDMRPSGLLDEESEPVKQVPATEPREVNRLAARSRSREDRPLRLGPVPPPRDAGMGTPSSGFDAPKGKGGFDGLGSKGRGKGGKDIGKGGKPADGEEDAPKEEPNFEASGLLAMEDNSKNGIPLKFTVPQEARMPTMKWRIYIFTKQEQERPKVVHIHRMVGVLFGKDRRVADIPTDHPTCSKQQAVLHHRLAPNGMVKPYIMDLESTNGTFLNGKRLEPARYYELREKDVLKFGLSTREFVLLHAGSASHMKIDLSQLRSDSE